MKDGVSLVADDNEEKLEVVDEGGTTVHLAKRGVIHTEGLLHKAVHCFVFDARQRILLQQRSFRCTPNT